RHAGGPGGRHRLEPACRHKKPGRLGRRLGSREAGGRGDRGLRAALRDQGRGPRHGAGKHRLQHSARTAHHRRGRRALSDKVIIHTDGACSGNPGPGGWGAILEYGGHTRELKGGEALTTNNKMELTAAIEALTALKRPCEVEIHTDSQYVTNGVQSWMHGWKRNGWKTADKKPVKNLELWQALDEATKRHTIEWKWVKGHAGHELNERADQLANEGMAPFKAKRRDPLMPPV